MRTLVKRTFESSKSLGLIVMLATAALAGTVTSTSAQAPAAAPQRNPADVEVHLLPVQGNVYMLVGAKFRRRTAPGEGRPDLARALALFAA